MKFVFCWASILLFLFSCQDYPVSVQEALALSGENRAELEKVLEYGKKRGKVAYVSACFLIANMKYHESKSAISVDSVCHLLFVRTDSLYQAIFGQMPLEEAKRYKGREYDSLRLDLKERFRSLALKNDENRHCVPDLTTIRSEYLIDNIESALAVWEQNGYSYKTDFDFFKEFILPYRVTNEYPVLQRSTVARMFKNILSDVRDTSILMRLERYKTYVDRCRWLNHHVKVAGHLGIYDLFVPKFKMDCHNMTNWSCNVLRSQGIPATYEFTPLWKDRGNRHFWCVSPDSDGVLQPYTAPDNNLREDWESDIQYAGKVYRKTFGVQAESPCLLAGEGEYVPELFSQPLLLDQTFRYHQTVTLRLPLQVDTGNRLAYLCMFSTQDWIPVAWGKIDHRRKEVVFEQVPLNTLFYPVCYDNDVMLELASPFIVRSSGNVADVSIPLTMNELPDRVLDVTLIEERLFRSGKGGKIAVGLQYIPLVCDTTHRQLLHLLRKYPEKRRMKVYQERLVGACLLGGNSELGEYDTICRLQEVPHPYLQEWMLDNGKRYRYYRFCTADGGPVNIAHMEFLGNYSADHSCIAPTPLPIFCETEGSRKETALLFRIKGIPLCTGSHPEYAFDNDFDTYVASSGIGMDFGSPVNITCVRFAPRNANNMIVPGNSYQLMYYDKGWKEHEVLYAEHHYLDFENVPVATLYWLRNLTTGKEELPFFYVNGNQYFLHTDTLPANACVQ